MTEGSRGSGSLDDDRDEGPGVEEGRHETTYVRGWGWSPFCLHGIHTSATEGGFGPETKFRVLPQSIVALPTVTLDPPFVECEAGPGFILCRPVPSSKERDVSLAVFRSRSHRRWGSVVDGRRTTSPSTSLTATATTVVRPPTRTTSCRALDYWTPFSPCRQSVHGRFTPEAVGCATGRGRDTGTPGSRGLWDSCQDP